MASNLYELLGVERDASPDKLRKAYHKKALQTHPDKLPAGASAEQKAQAEEQFRLVSLAYEVLNDTRNRELYDRHGVWPPPTAAEERGYQGARGDAFDPFTSDPFFASPFGGRGPFGRRGPFGFTDPFELFNSLFGDIHRFDDPFFSGPSGNSFFGSRDPFGMSSGDPFGGSMLSPFGGGFPFGRSLLDDFQPGEGRRVYSSSTRAVGMNGQWVSQSSMTRSINGRTETIVKRRDAQGNEHITYSSPDGERYTINGIEQPPGTRALPGGPSDPPPVTANAAPRQIPNTAYQQPQSFRVPITESVPAAGYPPQSPPPTYTSYQHPTPMDRRASHRASYTQANQPPVQDPYITSKRSSHSVHSHSSHHSHRGRDREQHIEDLTRQRSSRHRSSRHDSPAGSHDSRTPSRHHHHHPEDRDHDHNRLHRRHTHEDGVPPIGGQKRHQGW